MMISIPKMLTIQLIVLWLVSATVHSYSVPVSSTESSLDQQFDTKSASFQSSSLSSSIVNSTRNENVPNFRDTLRIKLKLVNDANQKYGYGYYYDNKQYRLDNQKFLEESLPESIFPSQQQKLSSSQKTQDMLSSSSADNDMAGGDEEVSAETMTTSGEDIRSIIGVESTSVLPPLSETDTDSMGGSKVLNELTADELKQEQMSDEVTNVLVNNSGAHHQLVKQTEVDESDFVRHQSPVVTNAGPVVVEHSAGGQSQAKRFKAAVLTKHTFEFRPVQLAHLQEPSPEPKIIEVEARSVPLEIHFKSASSRIKLVQSHKASGELKENEIQRTSSQEEPQRLVHLVRKPIIQEVREIITPYRRIVQEIKPVMEEIHTVITHEQDKGNRQTNSDRFDRQKLKPVKAAEEEVKEVVLIQAKQSNVEHNQPQQQSPKQSPTQTDVTLDTQQKVADLPKSFVQSDSTRQLEQSSSKAQQQNYGYSYGYGQSTPNRPLSKPEPPQPQPQPQQQDTTNEEEGGSDDDFDDGTIEVVNGNELEAILPARLMQEILSDYSQKQKPIYTVDASEIGLKPFETGKQKPNGQQISAQVNELPKQQWMAQATKGGSNKPPPPPPQLTRPAFSADFVNSQQELSYSPTATQHKPTGMRASSSNQNWRAIKPYVFYGGQQFESTAKRMAPWNNGARHSYYQY